MTSLARTRKSSRKSSDDGARGDELAIRTATAISVAIGVSIGLIGCGARSGLEAFEEPAAIDGAIDASDVVDADTSIVVRRDSGFDVHDAFDATLACLPQVDAFDAKIVPSNGVCTTVVRLSRAGVITGYRLICGPYAATDEPTAMKTAQSETGLGSSGCAATSATGVRPDDDYLFFHAASAAGCVCCGDGWFTAVSARGGSTLLGGEIALEGGRGLVYPPSFDDAKDLGSACGSRIDLPPVRGFDLTKMGSPSSVPSALAVPVMQSLLRTIWDTAIPDGLARKHYIFDAVVVFYTPHATAPLDAEWLVLLNSGWLE